MGNRAVITTEIGMKYPRQSVGVYLHWNGGRDSVESFLEYCKIMDFRAPDTDCYGWARLCQVVANFFGSDGLSIGIDIVGSLDCDNHDNGVYVIKGWDIVDRKYCRSPEQNSHSRHDMLEAINDAQPEDMQSAFRKRYYNDLG